MLNGMDAPAPARAFTSVDFPSAMSAGVVYSAANRPPGSYPWPITVSGGEFETVSLETATYPGSNG